MPKAEEEIIFDSSLEKLWLFFSDLITLSKALRFVERAEEGCDKKILWKIKFPMSATTKTPFLEANFFDVKPQEKISWEAKGENIVWRGEINLESIEENKTRVRISLEVEGLGPMAKIINPVASLQISGQLKYFINQVKKLI
jgi:uncharacterized membrane protein